MSALGRILIIEDDALIRRGLCESLGAAGFDTVAAQDVAGGRQQARWAHPDLIILDLGLPDGNGLDVLEVLAESGALVPVLVLTGLDASDVKMPALRSGVQEFLKKPVREPALLHAVAKLLATSDATRSWSPRGSGTFDWRTDSGYGTHRR